MPALRRLGDQRCTGRVLHMLGEITGRRGDTELAGVLKQSVQAAEPAADEQTLALAERALARLGH